MSDVVIIESVTEAGTEWLVSFDGPNPDDDKCVRCANGEEAAKLKRLVDGAKVAPLAAMLDRLGGDGAYHALNGHDAKTVADSMFAFSQWLEARARCDALVDTLKAIDPAAFVAFMRTTGEERGKNNYEEWRGEISDVEVERRHEAMLREAIVNAMRALRGDIEKLGALKSAEIAPVIQGFMDLFGADVPQSPSAKAANILAAARRFREAWRPFQSMTLDQRNSPMGNEADRALFDAELALVLAIDGRASHGAPADCVRPDCLHEPADSACLPAADARPETGPMRFADDWAGIFLRGDYACGMSIALDAALTVMADGKKPHPMVVAQLRGLGRVLASCNEGDGEPANVQQMRPFAACVEPTK